VVNIRVAEYAISSDKDFWGTIHLIIKNRAAMPLIAGIV
jgi:hypothetical protein